MRRMSIVGRRNRSDGETGKVRKLILPNCTLIPILLYSLQEDLNHIVTIFRFSRAEGLYLGDPRQLPARSTALSGKSGGLKRCLDVDRSNQVFCVVGEAGREVWQLQKVLHRLWMSAFKQRVCLVEWK